MTQRIIHLSDFPRAPRLSHEPRRNFCQILPFPCVTIARSDSGSLRQDRPGPLELWYRLYLETLAHTFGVPPSVRADFDREAKAWSEATMPPESVA